MVQGLDRLWAYQQADLDIDRAEQEVKKSPERQKLVRTRNVLVDQQNQLNAMTEAMAEKQAVYEKVAAAYSRIAEQAEEYERIIKDEEDFITKEELEQMRREEMDLLDSLKKCEKELSALSADMKSQLSKLGTIRTKIAEAKKNYPIYKEQYDAAVAQVVERSRPLVEERDKLAKEVPQILLERYKAVKKQRPVPVARLIGDQCGGCFMNIAQLVVQRVHDEDQIVVCENCGRILYPKD